MPRNVAIGLGLMEFPFAGVAGFWRWVDLCEAGGIDSLWQTDRMISREPILECMSVMAALAGRTRRLKFGVNVLSLAFRDPVLLAKQCATIDVLSEGRLLPAFGIGSPLAPEWRTLNLDTKTYQLFVDNASLLGGGLEQNGEFLHTGFASNGRAFDQQLPQRRVRLHDRADRPRRRSQGRRQRLQGLRHAGSEGRVDRTRRPLAVAPGPVVPLASRCPADSRLLRAPARSQ